MIIRTAVSLPQRAGYTFVDPATSGLAFPMIRHLPTATLAGSDLRRELEGTVSHIRRIVSTYLDASVTAFEELPEEMRLSEPYEFVVAADFPNGYDARSAELLEQIARTGPRAGVYVIVHLNRDRQRASPELAPFRFDGAHVVDVGEQQLTIGDALGSVAFDVAPAGAIQEAVLQRITAMPPRDRAVPWDELNRTREPGWWTETSDLALRATIGRHGAGELLDIWFGTDTHQLRSSVHGVLGAMPGAGKSTLLHNLICTLATRYSPDELELYLIDGKFGVEFRPYRKLPHAAVVSLRTPPALARSVLDDLVAEMARRNACSPTTAWSTSPATAASASRSAHAAGAARGRRVPAAVRRRPPRHRLGRPAPPVAAGPQRRDPLPARLAAVRYRRDAPSQRDLRQHPLRMAMQLAQSDVASLTEFGSPAAG